MYYILYEGLKIESNEPVYCTVYRVQCTVHCIVIAKHKGFGISQRLAVSPI